MQWFSNFSGRAGLNCFWHVPRWCSCSWSGDHTWGTTLVTSLLLRSLPSSRPAWASPCTALPSGTRAYAADDAGHHRSRPSVSRLGPGMPVSPGASSGPFGPGTSPLVLRVAPSGAPPDTSLLPLASLYIACSFVISLFSLLRITQAFPSP